MPTSADKVLQYLEEIHALETHLVSVLTTHIAMTPRSEYRDLLERHRYETRTHVQRIEQRLTELGRSSSLLHVVYAVAQDVVGQGTALVLAPLNLIRGGSGEEKLLKNAKDEAASETLEIVSYDALEAVAETVGDARTAVLAREHRTQEELFLADLRRIIPGLAADVIDAEVGGHPHYDPRTTGAADTARRATQTAKGTARQVRAGARTATGQAAAATRAAAQDGSDAARASVATAGSDDEIAISGYDELTVDQVLAKLKTLSTGELAAVDGYERGGRARKRILDRVAALRAKKVDQELAKL